MILEYDETPQLNTWQFPRWTRGLLAVGLISEGSLWFAAGIARPEDFNTQLSGGGTPSASTQG
jgi:hypothetical protein